MNGPEANFCEVKILKLLDEIDLLRDRHDASLAHGDRFSANFWLKRIRQLAKEIDDVMIANEAA